LATLVSRPPVTVRRHTSTVPAHFCHKVHDYYLAALATCVSWMLLTASHLALCYIAHFCVLHCTFLCATLHTFVCYIAHFCVLHCTLLSTSFASFQSNINFLLHFMKGRVRYRPSFFYVLWAVRPYIMIVFFYQLDAQILYFNTFITLLYMFRALLCSSSGGKLY
jgi:hypothetical protein